MVNVMVIGAGAVGAAAAYELAQTALARVLLYDVDDGRARGRVMDIRHAVDNPRCIQQARDLSRLSDAQLILVAAGVARQSGMQRADLATRNAIIVQDILGYIAVFAPSVPVVIITNPCEALTLMAHERWPRLRVFGFGCSLDQWRMRHLIAASLGCGAGRVKAMVIGTHSDAMIPLSRLASVDGVPVSTLLSDQELSRIEDRTRTAGTRVVEALGTHSGFIAAGRAAAALATAVVCGDGGLYPLSVATNGAYGIDDACLALPVDVSSGSFRSVALGLTESEENALYRCAQLVRTTVAKVTALAVGERGK